MTGTFDSSFEGDGRARIKGRADPAVVAACADRPAEAAVIGALLRDDRLIDEAADKLRSEDFSDLLFGQVFDAIVAMQASEQIATPITVAQRFLGDEDLSSRGGARYLAELASSDRADRGMGYVDHLVDLSRRRFLAIAAGEVRGRAADTSRPIDAVVGDMEGALASVLFWSASRPAIGFAQAWDSAIKKIEAIGTGQVERGIVIPELVEWNDICGGGMFMGQLILLGGRPGMGKTAVALTVARRTAEAGHGVLFISREMPVEQLMMRIVADMLFEAGSSATLDDVLNGRLAAEDYRRAAQIRDRIDQWPLVFEEPATLNANRIGPLIRRHQRELQQRGVKLGLVVVDYLGLLDPPTKRSNREQEMGDTSREMKNVARATGVTMLALAQLNRGVEQRDDKRPLLSDLRDSGSLEQDADTVIFAYRAEYYLKQTEPDVADVKKREAWEIDMGAERDRLDIYSAKVRQGAPTRRKVYFFGGRQAIRSGDYYRSGGGWGPM
ncbi:replicative DNA helicase [Sphingomonas paucimobilis]|uniref:replicative DNA helicase n=1 Tax=Sphingomonas paucimobilis TaxID=13689 RepID=UPI0031DF8C69